MLTLVFRITFWRRAPLAGDPPPSRRKEEEEEEEHPKAHLARSCSPDAFTWTRHIANAVG